MWADSQLDSLIPGWMCGGFKYLGIFPSSSSPLSLPHPLIDQPVVPKQPMEKRGEGPETCSRVKGSMRTGQWVGRPSSSAHVVTVAGTVTGRFVPEGTLPLSYPTLLFWLNPAVGRRRGNQRHGS